MGVSRWLLTRRSRDRIPPPIFFFWSGPTFEARRKEEDGNENKKQVRPQTTIDARVLEMEIGLDPKILSVNKRLDSKDVDVDVEMWIERPSTREA